MIISLLPFINFMIQKQLIKVNSKIDGHMGMELLFFKINHFMLVNFMKEMLIQISVYSFVQMDLFIEEVLRNHYLMVMEENKILEKTKNMWVNGNKVDLMD